MEYRKCPKYSANNLQFKVFLREVAVFTSTVILKKSAVIKFGGFDENLLRHQDLQFLIDALKENNFYVINEYLVKLHTDSEINKPNVKKMIKNKKAFFESVSEEFRKYSKKDQNRIKNAHCYEIVFAALKSKNLGVAIKYTFKAGISIASIKDLLKRYKDRHAGK